MLFLKEEVNKFNQGNKIKWKRTFGGAYDLVSDDFLVDFVKSNNLIEIVNHAANQEYVLADAKLRMYIPGEGYLQWHRDTYFKKW